MIVIYLMYNITCIYTHFTEKKIPSQNCDSEITIPENFDEDRIVDFWCLFRGKMSENIVKVDLLKSKFQ